MSKPSTPSANPAKPARARRAAAKPADAQADAGSQFQISTESVAALVGITDRTLRNWRTTKGAPVPEKGFRTTEEVRTFMRWHRAEIEREASDDASQLIEEMGGSTVEAEELRGKRLDNRMKEHKVGLAYGELLEKPRYHHNLSLCLVEINTQVQMLGAKVRDRVAAESDPFVCQDIIDEFVAKILGDLNLENALHPPGEIIGPMDDDGADGEPVDEEDEDEEVGSDDDDG
jgi:hypothetical protein